MTLKTQLPLQRVDLRRLFQDKPAGGWVAWGSDIALYASPAQEKSSFQPWEPTSQQALESVRAIVLEEDFWERLSDHYAEENHQESTTLDNISCVKSICAYAALRRPINY